MNRNLLTLLLTIAFLGGIVAGCSNEGKAGAKGQKYHCPMHPTYVSDRMGDCPICNMKLVPIKENAAAPKPMAAAAPEDIAHVNPGQYYCPMDTEVVRDEPTNCPECNMKLIQKPHGDHASSPAAPVPGRTSVYVSPEKRQLIGLSLEKVENRNLSRAIRTTALVEHDETRYTRIAPRFAGWVRQLHVNYTGAPVEKGQPMFSVYSPELFSSETEYLVAWRAVQQLNDASSSLQRGSAESLLAAARLRLSLFQVNEEEIRHLEERGKASAELLFRAPFSGHVITKRAVEGTAFQAGETLFEIADLSHVWLRAYVNEGDMPLVREGQHARIHFAFLGNKYLEAKVTFVYPHIDPQTRRGQVRLELQNEEHLIRPDMWANVELQVDPGERLAVPASALINTGQRYVAFVQTPDQHFAPREVGVGLKTDDYFEVLSGLSKGEQVVSRALFLVDSESQLKAAIAGMAPGAEHQH